MQTKNSKNWTRTEYWVLVVDMSWADVTQTRWTEFNMYICRWTIYWKKHKEESLCTRQQRPKIVPRNKQPFIKLKIYSQDVELDKCITEMSRDVHSRCIVKLERGNLTERSVHCEAFKSYTMNESILYTAWRKAVMTQDSSSKKPGTDWQKAAD